jgi:toxin CptA
MDIMIRGLAFAAAACCAGLMGFAIQRGATCTVAAIDEVVNQRRFGRLVALFEASLWVTGGLLIARQLGGLPQAPAGYALSARTFAGAALLGAGAFINRACVFGAIARFGSGEWSYAATPVGFYLGCLTVESVFGSVRPSPLATGSIVFSASTAAVWIFATALAVRVGAALIPRSRAWPAIVRQSLWSPHAATTVIGIAFLSLLLLVGAWAYTDALADLARGSTRGLPARLLLGVCLLIGAAVGGWTSGRWHPTRITRTAVLRCLVGGAVMGWGSLLIPGSNDGLILVGMPMLWPYAWAAFLTMCAAIAGALWLQARVAAGQTVAPI